MEKKVKILGIVRWLCFPLGYLMYFITKGSFGTIAAVILGVIATVAFWVIVRNEQTRIIGLSIAQEIKAAISETGDIENIIEIKSMKSGIIARVYLVNAKDRVSVIHRAIVKRIDDCSFKKYLWIMQLTDMPGKGSLKETQKMLNEQLLDELMKKRKGEND